MTLNGIKKMGLLSLSLLGIMVVMAVTFIVGGQFQKSICEDIDNGVYEANACYTDANKNVTSQSTAFNSTGSVITSINTVIGFISVLVIIAIAVILVQNVRSISGGNNDV